MSNLKDKLSRILGLLGSRKKIDSNLGLKGIRDTDVFICSFPKSGNTWLRFIIANAISSELITMKNINEFVPGLYNFQNEINNKSEDPRYIKVHHPYFHVFPKTVYIHRDYRDVLVSYFHYTNKQSTQAITWDEFIKSEVLKEPFGTWMCHVEKALEHKSKHPDRILFLSYEKMLKDPFNHAKEIISFCGIQAAKKLETIVELTNIQQLQELEQRHGTVYDIPGLTFFRSGEAGQWKEYFTQAQLDEILTSDMRALFQKLNYTIE